MSTLEHDYLLSRSNLAVTAETVARPSRRTGAAYVPVLTYSSPWPWVLALAISSAMWAGIGWMLWKLA